MSVHSVVSRRAASSCSRVNSFVESNTVANRPIADFDDTVRRTKLQLQLLQTMKSNPRYSKPVNRILYTTAPPAYCCCTTT